MLRIQICLPRRDLTETTSLENSIRTIREKGNPQVLDPGVGAYSDSSYKT